jgi:hypothetical protein
LPDNGSEEDGSVTDRPTVHEVCGEESRRTIIYTNGDSESLLLTSAGTDLFRLEQSSFLSEARYHDVIRASSKVDGSLEFAGLAVPSGLHTQDWLLSKALIESAEFDSVLNWVTSVGGNWELAFGGLLLLHVPVDLAGAAQDRINLLLSPESTG